MKTKPLLLIILSIFLNATGDPYINIKLKPMATNEYGEVLFQTYSDINTHGSYSYGYDKFGWLLVSNGYDVASTLCDFDTNAYSKKEKAKMKFLTKDITFELKKIDGHWYIVIINGVETDCSA